MALTMFMPQAASAPVTLANKKRAVGGHQSQLKPVAAALQFKLHRIVGQAIRHLGVTQNILRRIDAQIALGQAFEKRLDFLADHRRQAY